MQRSLKKAKEYGNREKDAEENEKDDIDAGDITSIQFWSLGDTYRSNWRDSLTIELLPEEAAFLKSQIVMSQRTSLFAFILNDKEKMNHFSEVWSDYSVALREVIQGDAAVLHLKKKAEDEMYGLMCRTERISVMDTGDYIDDSSVKNALSIS